MFAHSVIFVAHSVKPLKTPRKDIVFFAHSVIIFAHSLIRPFSSTEWTKTGSGGQASRRGKPARRILGKLILPRNSVYGCRKTLGGLFWLRKNPGLAVLAAEKPWAGYLGCGK